MNKNDINNLGFNEIVDKNILRPNINYGEIIDVMNNVIEDNYLFPISSRILGAQINHLCFDAESFSRDVAKKLLTDKDNPFSLSKKISPNSPGKSLDVDFDTFKRQPKVSVNNDFFSNYEGGLNKLRESVQRILGLGIRNTRISLAPYDYRNIMHGEFYDTLLSSDGVRYYPKDAIDLRCDNSFKNILFNEVAIDNGRFSENNIIKNKCTISYDSMKISADLDDVLYEYYSNEYEGSNNDEILDAFEDGGENNIKETLIDFIENQNKGCMGRNLSYLSLQFAYDSLLEMDLKQVDADNMKIFGRYVSLFELFEKSIADMISNGVFCRLGVNYRKNESPDFISLLRTNNIYDSLPYIGKVDNNFSFEEDGASIRKNIGISYKMNSKVESSKTFNLGLNYFPTSLDYHLRILNVAANGELKRISNVSKNSETTDLIDCLIKSVVFKFFLLGIADENYDSVAMLETDISVIRESSDSIEGIKRCLRLFEGQLLSAKRTINLKLQAIKSSLELSIFSCMGTGKRNPKEYNRDFLIFKSFLPNDAMEELLRKTASESRSKKIGNTCMVPEGTNVDGVLYKISFNFKIETISYEDSGDDIRGQFKIFEDKYLNLNIAYIPSNYLNSSKMNRLRYLNVPGNTTFYITYSTKESFYVNGGHAFLYETIYRIICSILVEVVVYISQHKLNVLNRNSYGDNELNYQRLSVLQIRPQDFGGDENIESNGFIRKLNKELDFSMGKKYEINSQGIDFKVSSENISMKHDSSIFSLYSKKEKVFKLSENLGIKKYAIISVTSTVTEGARTSDGQVMTEYDKVTVIGNISKIDIKNQTVNIKTGNNFSYSEELRNVYSRAHDLRDKVNELIAQGYKNIIYIANAPDTQKISLRREDKANLYFFNESILEELIGDGTKEFNLYPLYIAFDRGYDYRPNKTPFFMTNISDCDKGIIPIFSIYTGAQVNSTSRYNSIVNYYGLKSIYDNSVLNGKISRYFVGHIKVELAKIMYLYHTSKQQKYMRGKNVVPKVNPFDELIGVEGIGKISKETYDIEEYVNGKKVVGRLSFNGLVLTSNVVDKMHYAREEGDRNG